VLDEDVDIFNDTFSINVKTKNIERSQAAPGSLELHQQLTTHNDFFNNYRKNGNDFAVTTSTRARIGSFKTNNREPLKSSRPGFVTL